MKRNNLMRIACALLVVVMLTCSVASGTFAKYTSTVKGYDTARTAKFGFNVYQTEGETVELTAAADTPRIDIFGTSQDDTGVVNGDADGYDVSVDDKLLAPGMEGYFEFTFNNSSEVAIKLTFDTFGYDGKYAVSETESYEIPLIFYFNGNYYSELYNQVVYTDTTVEPAVEYKGSQLTYRRHEQSGTEAAGANGTYAFVSLKGDMAALLADVNTYCTMPATNEPGSILRKAAAFIDATDGQSVQAKETIQLAWFWAFEALLPASVADPVNSAAEYNEVNGINIYKFDEYDTMLGVAAANALAGIGEDLIVTMTPVVRATQIDTFSEYNVTPVSTWEAGYRTDYKGVEPGTGSTDKPYYPSITVTPANGIQGWNFTMNGDFPVNGQFTGIESGNTVTLTFTREANWDPSADAVEADSNSFGNLESLNAQGLLSITDRNGYVDFAVVGDVLTINSITDDLVINLANSVEEADDSYYIYYYDNVEGVVVTVPAFGTKFHNEVYNIDFTIGNQNDTNYVFLGWATSANATTPDYTADGTNTYSANANLKLYAVWVDRYYAITYDANGGEGSVPTGEKKTYKTDYAPVFTPLPTYEGHDFLGWDASATATTPTYTADNGALYTTDAATTLYAVWKLKEYTISFNVGEGSVATVANMTKTHGTAITLPAAPAAKDGYTFKEWNTQADGLGTAYAAGAAYTAEGDATLYAIWNIAQYTISFNVGDGSTATVADVIKTHGTAINLPAAPEAKTGYTFKEWNTQADGLGTAYAAGASYSTEGVATLYGIWEVSEYTVSFNSNGGSAVSSQNIASGSTVSAPTAPTLTGYTFKGWFTANAAGSDYGSQVSFPYTVTNDVTFYAKWEANSTYRQVDTISTGKSYIIAYGTSAISNSHTWNYGMAATAITEVSTGILVNPSSSIVWEYTNQQKLKNGNNYLYRYGHWLTGYIGITTYSNSASEWSQDGAGLRTSYYYIQTSGNYFVARIGNTNLKFYEASINAYVKPFPVA